MPFPVGVCVPLGRSAIGAQRPLSTPTSATLEVAWNDYPQTIRTAS